MSSDSAASGGILVILAILVALGGVYFYTQYSGNSAAPDVTVNLPNATNNE